MKQKVAFGLKRPAGKIWAEGLFSEERAVFGPEHPAGRIRAEEPFSEERAVMPGGDGML